MGDIDRKTFYLHYDTIYDVVTEMEQEVAGEVRQLLAQKKDITISEIFCGLNELMEKNFEFYRQIAGNTSISFLKNECKNILKQELKTAYWKTSGLPENEFLVYAEYCASGIIGIYTDWLAGNNPLSLEELVEIASDAVECGWQKMQ